MSVALPHRGWVPEDQDKAFDTACELIVNYRAYRADHHGVDGYKTASRQAHLSSLQRERREGKRFRAAVQKASAEFNAEDNSAV